MGGTIRFLFLFFIGVVGVVVKPRLFEGLMCDAESRQLMEGLMRRVDKHLFFKRYVEVGVREGLFSDEVGALGRMYDTIVGCAYPELIGRGIVSVRYTGESAERFPLDGGAVAYTYAEGAVARFSGVKNRCVDVNADVVVEVSECWSRKFLEDASWNVLDGVVGNFGRVLGEEETRKVLSLYGSVADGDLAGGASLDQGGEVMDWRAVMRLYDAVRGENWRPNVLVLHETQLHQLLVDDKFIDARYLSSLGTDVEHGLVRSVSGMKVYSSTLVPNGTAYAIDTRVAAVMLIRRDVMIEDWVDSRAGLFGVRASTRFGLGVLRSNAIAKMTGIKNSL